MSPPPWSHPQRWFGSPSQMAQKLETSNKEIKDEEEGSLRGDRESDRKIRKY